MICQSGFGFIDTQNLHGIRYILPNGIKCNTRFLLELHRLRIMTSPTRRIRTGEIIIIPVCNSKVAKYRRTHEEYKPSILWVND